MEIHSSSLAFIPNGYQPKGTQKQETESVKQEVQSLPLANEIEKLSEIDSFQQLTTIIESQHTQPLYSRKARAVDAYVQESIKPVQALRSELISNIDLFA